jgi:acyl-CoA reductase-like NAD-dependent aldehyde dehydrogenase
MAIFHEETFGPVAAIMPFDTEAEAVEIANDTIYGLAAYLYTRDIGRCWRVGRKLAYGMVAINSPKMTGAPVPFGGVKQSGLGREGGREGLSEFLETKYLCMAGLGR